MRSFAAAVDYLGPVSSDNARLLSCNAPPLLCTRVMQARSAPAEDNSVAAHSGGEALLYSNAPLLLCDSPLLGSGAALQHCAGKMLYNNGPLLSSGGSNECSNWPFVESKRSPPRVGVDRQGVENIGPRLAKRSGPENT